MREIEHIVIHATGGGYGDPFSISDCARDHYKRGIRSTNPGSRTAWHFIIDRDGTCLMGRGLREPARLTNYLNNSAVAIALVGGVSYDKSEVERARPEQHRALVQKIVELQYFYKGKLSVISRDELRGDRGTMFAPGFYGSSWWLGCMVGINMMKENE